MAKTKSSETPLMTQHNAIKSKYPDAVLLFRVGDFYETFNQDAVIASKVLGITLTKRANGSASSVDLAGFPYHALDTYLHKLVKAGYRVAICDQLEDPKTVKGIVKRGVTEIVTPGVTLNDKILEQQNNNYLCALFFQNNIWAISLIDISTGIFYAAEGGKDFIEKLIHSFKPSEILIAKSQQKELKQNVCSGFYTFALEDWIFDPTYTFPLITQHFKTTSMKGFGLQDSPQATLAAGVILHYLKEMVHPNLQQISTLKPIVAEDFLWMDQFTIRNLELLSTNNPQGKCLFDVLDNTTSPMGSRLLKHWLLFPLQNITQIEQRLTTVTFLIQHSNTVALNLEKNLKHIGDMERMISKLPMRKNNPREIEQIAKALKIILLIKTDLQSTDQHYLNQISEQLNAAPTLQKLIQDTLIENPPSTPHKGGLINTGISAELDELREIATNGKNILLKLQQQEIESTGINSLKIAYNNVFGYYLEVTNTHKDKVPSHWIRKQTLSNAERYITPEIKEYEEKILGAEEKMIQIETGLYEKLLTAIQEWITILQTNAQLLATLDVLNTFAQNARNNNYCCPTLHPQFEINITDGRHPVIEKCLPIGETYISNSVHLNPQTQQIIILTGPNMSGKSAVLRQTALITLMAHIGSYVPANQAHIGLTDKIFTRVGASDNLSGGESTFMVEMHETASIMNTHTAKSLIILDEIGRGTSTYDGISIAWSIVEYLHNTSPHQPLTLFATHYHELNILEEKLTRTKNYHVAIQELENKILFLRKLKPGGAAHSFGIHVATMAGMPALLIQNAEKVLKKLENQAQSPEGAPASTTTQKLQAQQVQLTFFDTLTHDLKKIKEILEDTDLNRLTPVEALLKLQQMQNVLLGKE